ncbi:hypothetical protein TH25_25670 [Thalassospira profundimaris]|uniref:Phytase-like domain-containing protein n=1 Tax=Thalassospira profundimaris TaxID=502049 RepID=A0A367W6Q8_9PROT|nr:hypothetical protein [Thalassospira profundimaris]RCK36949.1 hypothetical protein TH25_25670 [Thalassospira profundimaris]
MSSDPSSQIGLTQDGSEQAEPKVIALQDGGFLLLMNIEDGHSTSWDPKAQRYDASGQPVGDLFDIQTQAGNDTLPSGVELSDGRLLLFSVNQGSNKNFLQATGQLFTADGHALAVRSLSVDKQGMSGTLKRPRYRSVLRRSRHFVKKCRGCDLNP